MLDREGVKGGEGGGKRGRERRDGVSNNVGETERWRKGGMEVR